MKPLVRFWCEAVTDHSRGKKRIIAHLYELNNKELRLVYDRDGQSGARPDSPIAEPDRPDADTYSIMLDCDEVRCHRRYTVTLKKLRRPIKLARKADGKVFDYPLGA